MQDKFYLSQKSCQLLARTARIRKMTSDWLKKYPPKSVVLRAYEFAKEAHKDIKRESGEPYLNHCLEVAAKVNEWKLGEASVAAALLHDIVEDTNYTVKDIEKYFGAEIAFLVDGLTKLDAIQFPTKSDAKIESLRKFIVSSSKDLRIIIIKLADRLHNMQTIGALNPERQKKFAWETNEIYAPLAYRLGMQRLSGELEDLAFPYAYPEEHAWLTKAVKDSFAVRVAYTEKLRPVVLKLLRENSVNPISVDARAKRYASLYKKLMRYDMDLEKIHDLVAIRIMVNTVEECYTVLGIIHKIWQPVPKQFDDYIARPKPNGYRSLHTTVFCVDNKITEFQIRTKEMHEEAELGIAAHWAYQQIKDEKEKHKNWAGVTQRKELLWVEQLRNWQKDFSNNKEFIEAVKTDLFKDRIFVLTPHNDVIDLPVGATPIDFAYRIHSAIGDQCVGAKVNNRIVTLDHQLNSGDLVEIITQRGKKPSKDWLRFVKTILAKKQIKSSVRENNKTLQKKVDNHHMEFKIINQGRPGYLKDLTNAFAKSKIYISHLNSAPVPRMAFSIITLKCEILSEQKIQKILVRLKKINGTKEVSYKFNR
mgnify:FL=1